MKTLYPSPLIAPSILSANFACLEKQLKLVEDAGADVLHVDVMDGHFVPNLTIGPLVVKALKNCTALPLDVHLMIQNPEHFILPFSQAGADWLTIHAEVMGHHHIMIQTIKNSGMKAGIALNPATPLSAIEWLLNDLDLILIMSVNPGFAGQAFIPMCFEKVRMARRMIEQKGSQTLLAVDGGIKIENCLEVTRAGAQLIVMGSEIFGAPDPGGRIKEVKEKLRSVEDKNINTHPLPLREGWGEGR